jgi:uncharacterized protein
MALQLDEPTGVNVIHRVEPGCVWVNGQAWTQSVVVPWQGEVRAWGPADFAGLSAAHFEALLQPRPELLLFGSGSRLRFPPPALLWPLIQAGVALDTMDLGAACRTYTVLASEQRQVTVALLLGGSD